MRLLRDQVFNGGLRPRAPGIYRLPARMAGFGGGQGRLRPFRLLSRRSGCVPAVPYPPLRYSQSGKHQPRRAILFQRTAMTPLTRCLTPGVHSTQTVRARGTVVWGFMRFVTFPLDVEHAGDAPTLVQGVFQIKARLPQVIQYGVGTGTVASLVVSIGGVDSPATTVWIKAVAP